MTLRRLWNDLTGATGLQLTPVAANPGDSNTLWISSVDSKVYRGAVEVGSLITSLSLGDGSAAAPAIAFTSDTDTGLYRVGANQLGFATGGSLRQTITDTQVISTVVNVGPNGTAALPAWSFAGDPDTGMFDAGANQLGFATNGVVRQTLTDTQAISTVVSVGPAGTAALPAWSFSGDPNTGMYNIGADQIGFSTNGTLRQTISTTQVVSTLVNVGPAGTAALPAWSFSADPNTGIYNIGADQLGFSTGGTLRKTISTTQIITTLVGLGPAGTAALPAWSFSGDPDTGMYSVGANSLGFSAGATNLLTLTSTGATFAAKGIFPATVAGAASITLPHGTLPSAPVNGDLWTTTAGIFVQINGLTVGPLAAASVTPPGGATTQVQYNNAGAFAGNAAFTFNSGTGFVSSTGHLADAGTAAAPSYSFTATSNAGMYVAGANTLGWSTGGVLRMSLDTSVLNIAVPIQSSWGTAGAPAITFISDLNTGVYRAGSDQLGFSTGGVSRLVISTTDVTSTLPLYAPAGSAAAPSHSFSGDPDTGVYSVGADALGIATSGALSATFDSAGRLSLGVRIAQALVIDNVTGNYARFLYNGTTVGDFGTANHVVSGGANTDFALTAVNGSLVLGTGTTPRVTISGTSVTSALIGIFPATTTGAASIRLPHGTAPTAPTNGDMWTTTAGVFARVNGSTVGPFGAGGTPGGANTEVQYNNAGAFAGNAGFTFSGGVLTATVMNAAGGFTAPSGSNGTPSYTFTTDQDTGMYATGANSLGFTTSGVLRQTISTTAITTTLPGLGPNGTVGSPAWSFSSSTSTGMYGSGATLGLSSSGVARLTMNASNVTIGTGLQLLAEAGTNSLPGYSFTSENSSGMYLPGAGFLRFAVSGTQRIGLTTTDADFAVNIRSQDGSAASPGITFSTDADTGFYRIGANSLGISTNGILRVTIDAANVTSTLAFAGPDGTAAAPSHSFASESIGMYRVSAGTIGFSTASTVRLTVSTTSVASALPILAPAPTTSSTSMRLPHGTAPTTPTNGDIWTTTAGLFVRINGATIGPLT